MQFATTILSIIIVTIMITPKSTMANQRQDVVLTLFADPEFAGTAATILVRKRKCTTVPTILNDKVSSISFNSTSENQNCVLGFTDFNCIGTRFTLFDGTTCLNNLAAPLCSSDNTISSFRTCEPKDFKFALGN